MRPAYPLEHRPSRPSGEVRRWIEIAIWLVGFALLLAAPCAPERPGAGAPASAALDAVTAPRADARLRR